MRLKKMTKTEVQLNVGGSIQFNVQLRPRFDQKDSPAFKARCSKQGHRLL